MSTRKNNNEKDNNSTSLVRTLTCEICGEEFSCFSDTTDRCWCMDLENTNFQDSVYDCLCFS